MRLIAVFALFFLFSLPALAQDYGFGRESASLQEDGDSYSNIKFEVMAEKALAGDTAKFSFRDLRSFYVGTRQYAPSSENIVRQLVTHAYMITQGDNAQIMEQSLQSYNDLIRDHLANIGVVDQALSLSLQDPVFGDPEFFTWLREGLIAELLRSGDGKTPRGAYDIITMEEEGYLLAALGVQPGAVETSHSGKKYYNMHSVTDADTGEEFVLFIDATRPLARAEKIRERPVYVIDIGKQ